MNAEHVNLLEYLHGIYKFLQYKQLCFQKNSSFTKIIFVAVFCSNNKKVYLLKIQLFIPMHCSVDL